MLWLLNKRVNCSDILVWIQIVYDKFLLQSVSTWNEGNYKEYIVLKLYIIIYLLLCYYYIIYFILIIES